jgi:hypothetical protein
MIAARQEQERQSAPDGEGSGPKHWSLAASFPIHRCDARPVQPAAARLVNRRDKAGHFDCTARQDALPGFFCHQRDAESRHKSFTLIAGF